MNILKLFKRKTETTVSNMLKKNLYTLMVETEVELTQITLKPGQSFAVYLDREKEARKRKAVIVELRVTNEGKPEIFTDLKKVNIYGINDWKQMKE